jgi:hypothetical protein
VGNRQEGGQVDSCHNEVPIVQYGNVTISAHFSVDVSGRIMKMDHQLYYIKVLVLIS